MLTHVFLALLIILVVETKDGTVSVASAFAGHQEGNIDTLTSADIGSI